MGSVGATVLKAPVCSMQALGGRASLHRLSVPADVLEMTFELDGGESYANLAVRMNMFRSGVSLSVWWIAFESAARDPDSDPLTGMRKGLVLRVVCVWCKWLSAVGRSSIRCRLIRNLSVVTLVSNRLML